MVRWFLEFEQYWRVLVVEVSLRESELCGCLKFKTNMDGR